MKTAAVLWRHAQQHDLCPGARTFAAWRSVRWLRVRLGGRAIPIFPVLGYRDALHLHDVHHLLTGYSTRLTGELELAAWELASGGCRRHVLFWIDRLLAVVLGLLLCPRRLARAFRAGRRCRNLRASDVLESELDEIARRVGVAPPV